MRQPTRGARPAAPPKVRALETSSWFSYLRSDRRHPVWRGSSRALFDVSGYLPAWKTRRRMQTHRRGTRGGEKAVWA
ncbi:hypothetical protein MTO96_051260 [Rhipicephalus appendiculatus]